MDELIGRLVAETGIDRAAAEKAVGIGLDFLVEEGSPDQVQPLLAELPCPQGLIGKVDGCGTVGGVIGTGMRMMAAGPSMQQVRSVARVVLFYTRGTAGEDAIGEITAAVTGSAQFV